MTDKPPRVEILLKDERVPPHAAAAGRTPTGHGRIVAIVMLALLYLILASVFKASFEPRVEWVDSAGRALLEDRPVFWPLIMFAILGRFAAAMAAWYPDFMDPTKGLLKIPDNPALRRRRLVFRILYGTGLILATWTLFNNLAFADILGILRAVAFVVLILAGVAVLFRVALMSILKRLGGQLRPPPPR